MLAAGEFSSRVEKNLTLDKTTPDSFRVQKEIHILHSPTIL